MRGKKVIYDLGKKERKKEKKKDLWSKKERKRKKGYIT